MLKMDGETDAVAFKRGLAKRASALREEELKTARQRALDSNREEAKRIAAETLRRESFAKSREESSRQACERNIARARERGTWLLSISAKEALHARRVKR